MNFRSARNGWQVLVSFALVCFLAAGATGQRKQNDQSSSDRDVTILLTAHPHSDRMRDAASQLKADDFVVREDKRPEQIISVKRASEAPTILAVLIQDDLVSRVNTS